MKVLVVHVRHLHAGGEEAAVKADVAALGSCGIDTTLCETSSQGFVELDLATRVRLAVTFPNHRHGRTLIRDAILQHRPDVVHYHNLFPTISVGGIEEARRAGAATVLTLHNYRLSCIAGTHLLNGDICERCTPVHHTAGVLTGCYRSSRPQSLLLSAAVRRLWDAIVSGGLPDQVISLTDFMRDRLVAAGAPGGQVVVRPNCVEDGRPEPWVKRSGAVFVGRLSREKGVVPLVASWPEDGPGLTVVGSGPDEVALRRLRRSNVRIAGALSSEEVRHVMRRARALVMPSLCFEGLPMTVLEAYSEGTPVVGFSVGGVGECVSLQGDDFVVPLRNTPLLVELTNRVCGMDELSWTKASDTVCRLHEARYSINAGGRSLEAVYDAAIRHARCGEFGLGVGTA